MLELLSFVLATEEHSDVDQQLDSSLDPSASPLLAGARICVIETIPDCLVGFKLENTPSPPFNIHKIEKDSAAEKAGLKVNDVLLSVNGQSVIESSYEETIGLIKEARQQKSFQVVVKQSTEQKKYQPERDSDSSSLSYSSDDDNRSETSSITDYKPVHHDTNAIHEYQSM